MKGHRCWWVCCAFGVSVMALPPGAVRAEVNVEPLRKELATHDLGLRASGSFAALGGNTEGITLGGALLAGGVWAGSAADSTVPFREALILLRPALPSIRAASVERATVPIAVPVGTTAARTGFR